MIDRNKYMVISEVRQLRDCWRDRAAIAMQKKQTTDVQTWMLVDLALSTGLRAGEILLLETSNVDYEQCLLVVTRLKRRSGPVRETIDIHPTLRDHLKEYVAYMGIEGRIIDRTYNGIDYAWKRACRLAGLAERCWHLHAARHTVGTILTKNHGVAYAQKQLGHVDIATTSIYVHLDSESMQNALNGLY